MPDKSLSQPFRIEDGRRFHLKAMDPAETLGHSKEQAEKLLEQSVRRLFELQHKLYAQDLWSVLLVFQAMDAAGKDSTIEHVMTGVNPQGCQVFSFKAPSAEELDHDFLWRTTRCLPERGRIGIFNRSYYEEVLVVRVHPEILGKQKLPPSLLTRQIWNQRLEDITAFERHLSRNGVLILKFFLHVSPEEQRKRFLKRLDEPAKNWKFQAADVRERAFWKDYMNAYQDAIKATARPWAPWYVVPADHKWFTRLVVSNAIVEALQSLKVSYPEPEKAAREQLAAARAELLKEKDEAKR